jgi:glycosyltransferase involved in cell wall biosynthesis
MKLAVIIPALNEERTISEVIRAIPRSIAGIDTVQVIVIDDGSTDMTSQEARSADAAVVRHQENLGVGAAFHTGIKEALKSGADVIVNIDADRQFDPTDIPALIAPILQGRAAFVTATRFARPDLMPDMPAVKLWGNRWMTRIINFLTKKKFTDVSCGFRAYHRDAAMCMTLFGKFTYTQESFIDLAFKEVAMTEVPLKVRGEREHGKSRVANNLWRYGLKSATIIFRAARDYRPNYFFGLPGLIVFGLGLASGLFLLWHFFTTGQTYPYRSLVNVSGVLIIVGILLLFLSMIADMLHRNRMIYEEALHLARRAAYQRHDDKQ